MALPKITDQVDNISSQPDQPIISATSLKALFDEIGKDIKEFINNVFTVFLEGSSAASNLGQNNGSYGPTIQDAIDTITSAGVGTIPPDGTISNLKLATDVKVGSLATLLTTIKTSVVDAINELKSSSVTSVGATSPIASSGGLTPTISIQASSPTQAGSMSIAQATKLDGLRHAVSTAYTNNTTGFTAVGGLSVPVTAGKKYLVDVVLSYQSNNASYTGEGSVYLSSGSGTITGIIQAYHSTIVGPNVISAIGAIGLAGSTWQAANGTSICHTVSKLLFTCASSGNIAIGFRSTNASNTVTVTTGSVLYVQELN